MPDQEIDRTEDDYFDDAIATFGDRLEAARISKGLTVESLAKKIGVEPSKVETWESDADAPRSNRLQTLAGILGVSITWLITGQGDETEQVQDNYCRPVDINDALTELAKLKAQLQSSIKQIERLEHRLAEDK